MALTAKHSPLVAGGVGVSRAAPSVGPVRLLRAICIKGERLEVGAVLQLDRITASELISAGKAERAPAQLQAPVQTSAPPGDAKTTKKPAPQAASPSQKDLDHVQQ